MKHKSPMLTYTNTKTQNNCSQHFIGYASPDSIHSIALHYPITHQFSILHLHTSLTKSLDKARGHNAIPTIPKNYQRASLHPNLQTPPKPISPIYTQKPANPPGCIKKKQSSTSPRTTARCSQLQWRPRAFFPAEASCWLRSAARADFPFWPRAPRELRAADVFTGPRCARGYYMLRMWVR